MHRRPEQLLPPEGANKPALSSGYDMHVLPYPIGQGGPLPIWLRKDPKKPLLRKDPPAANPGMHWPSATLKIRSPRSAIFALARSGSRLLRRPPKEHLPFPPYQQKFRAGETDEGIEKLTKQVDRRPQEVIPLARLAYAYHQNGQTDLAHETFEALRSASSTMDLGSPMFQRLAPIAKELELPEDWRKPYQAAADIGFRPPLDSLGPFRWSPQAAPTWSLKDSRNLSAGSQDYSGKAHIVIFYLGHGCLHCASNCRRLLPVSRISKMWASTWWPSVPTTWLACKSRSKMRAVKILGFAWSPTANSMCSANFGPTTTLKSSPCTALS